MNIAGFVRYIEQEQAIASEFRRVQALIACVHCGYPPQKHAGKEKTCLFSPTTYEAPLPRT